ncbi:MAG: TonB-dependent receptor [Cellvibrionaceae bacterium]|nr:TonB-dependent receptor [Cellvibrionaceae bacterium]
MFPCPFRRSLAVILIASAPVAFSETIREPGGEAVQTVVVTGTRTPRLLPDSPVVIEVVSGDDVRQVAQTTLARALDVLPGVVVKRSNKEGYNIYMQGFDGDRVLVLVDGRRQVAPTGAAADLDQISVADIERIEILRGAGSVLYGSSAMGGVINIITRREQRNRLEYTGEVSTYAGNEIEGDEFSYQHRLEGALLAAGWRSRLSLQEIDDAGFDYDPATVAQSAAGSRKRFAHLSLGGDFYGIATDYQFRDLKDTKRRDSHRVQGQSTIVHYLSDVDQTQHDLEIRGRSDGLTAPSWKMAGRHTEHSEISGLSSDLRDTHIQLAELDGQRTWRLRQHEIVGGLAARQERLDQSKDGNPEIDRQANENLEMFAQYNFLGRGTEYLAGIRVQEDSDFGYHSAARASLMKKFSRGGGELRWRAGLGQSYRVPNLKERFYVFDHSNVGYIILGDERLLPETAVTANGSVTWSRDWRPDRELSLEVNTHYSEAKNLIDTLYDPTASREPPYVSVYRYANFARTEIRGLDFSGKYRWRDWNWQLNYSYLEARDKIADNPLPNRPRHQIKANMGRHFPALDLDALFYVVHEAGEYPEVAGQPVYRDEFLSLNLIVSQILTEHIHWRFGVENLLDNHRNPVAAGAGDFDARPVGSRRVFAGVTLKY